MEDQIDAEEAYYPEQDSTLEENLEDEDFEDASEAEEGDDDDDDEHNAASFLEVTLDPQQFDNSQDEEEEGSDEDDDNGCLNCGDRIEDHPDGVPCNIRHVNQQQPKKNTKRLQSKAPLLNTTTTTSQVQKQETNICPICDRSLGHDEKSIASHLCSHFTSELAEVYQDLKQCSRCKFGSDLSADSIAGHTRAKMLAAHHAADHGNCEELFEFLQDNQLMKIKRNQYQISNVAAANAKKGGMSNGPTNMLPVGSTMKLGKNCPICDQALPGAAVGGSGGQAAGRTHVADHFLAEMRELMPDPGTSCPECPFVSDRTDIAARHLALAHYQLDAILQNQEAVKLKRKDVKLSQVINLPTESWNTAIFLGVRSVVYKA